MHRNVTAIFRTREVAERVRRGLEEIGIPRRDIHIVPDPDGTWATGARAGSAPGGTATGAAGTAPGTTGLAGTSAVAPTGTPATTAGNREHPLHDANMLEAGADDSYHTDRLHELNLPEDDLRTYQHAVRRGDFVVSAEVDDDKVDKVKAIMRRPESEVHDIEHRASEFRNEDLVPHSKGHTPTDDLRARRLADDADRYHRTYERDRRLDIPGRS